MRVGHRDLSSSHVPRSLRQPPTSTEIAHPSSIGIAGFGFFVTSILNSLRGRIPGRGDGSSIRCPKDSDSFKPTIYCTASSSVGVCDMPFRPRDLADRMAKRRPDGFVRETFSLPREQARAKAKAFLKSYPSAAYMSEVERWRELPDGSIVFTMRRLPTAD